MRGLECGSRPSLDTLTTGNLKTRRPTSASGRQAAHQPAAMASKKAANGQESPATDATAGPGQ